MEGLITVDPEHKSAYTQNHQQFFSRVRTIWINYIHEQINTIPKESRILVTAHDAFEYFGRAYGMEVLGLQGISTVSEAGTGDVTKLANYIIEHQIKAIFVETSVPKKKYRSIARSGESSGI